ncbi:MAG TPA: hypothetical protein VK135_03655 [Candidatus Dormibacteraeota bacterium]|nr:hypothetical protein [Candidatus Dormibacteraeota bacterium]
MVSKRYDFDEEMVNRIKTIQQAKRLKTEKEVLINAINQYLLSEMIEDESIEFQTYQKMNAIENELKRLNNKMNHIDHGVSINNLFLTSDFEVNQHPKAIINRDTFDSEYFKSAKKEVTKLIREKDSEKRIQNTAKQEVSPEVNQKEKIQTTGINSSHDDDWLNV